MSQSYADYTKQLALKKCSNRNMYKQSPYDYVWKTEHNKYKKGGSVGIFSVGFTKEDRENFFDFKVGDVINIGKNITEHSPKDRDMERSSIMYTIKYLKKHRNGTLTVNLIPEGKENGIIFSDNVLINAILIKRENNNESKYIKKFEQFLNESNLENDVISFLKKKMQDDQKEYKGHIPTKYNPGSKWDDNSWVVTEIMQFLQKDYTTSYTLLEFSKDYDYEELNNILKKYFNIALVACVFAALR